MEKSKPTQIDQYIALVYSQNSLLNKIADLEERKKTACKQLRMDIESEKVKKIIHMQDENVNQQIFEYLKANNSNEFILLISDQHLFWEIQQRQIEPLIKSEDSDSVMKDLDLKTKMSEKAEQLLIRINERYSKIFQADAETEVARNQIKLQRPESRLKNQKKQA